MVNPNPKPATSSHMVDLGCEPSEPLLGLFFRRLATRENHRGCEGTGDPGGAIRVTISVRLRHSFGRRLRATVAGISARH